MHTDSAHFDVDIELGTVTLRLGDLLATGRGTILPLVRPQRCDSNVHMNGQPIAHADLSMTNERVIIRLRGTDA